MRTFRNLAVLSVIFLVWPLSASAAGTPITGYAWSDTIGWVDFNCSNSSSCGTSNWGITIASDGTLSGYAWSENVGWISANTADLAGCPSGTCSAKMNVAALNGWFKVLSADGNGWDGWISLSGSGYGPTLSSGALVGYTWGSDVVGWLQFDAGANPVQTVYTPCAAAYHCVGNSQYYLDAMCVDTLQQMCAYQCVGTVCVAPPAPSGTLAAGASITAKPTLVRQKSSTTVTWGVANASSCVVLGSNGDIWNGTSNTKTSKPIIQLTTFTLNCLDLVGASTTLGSVSVGLVPQYQEK